MIRCESWPQHRFEAFRTENIIITILEQGTSVSFLHPRTQPETRRLLRILLQEVLDIGATERSSPAQSYDVRLLDDNLALCDAVRAVFRGGHIRQNAHHDLCPSVSCTGTLATGSVTFLRRGVARAAEGARNRLGLVVDADHARPSRVPDELARVQSVRRQVSARGRPAAAAQRPDTHDVRRALASTGCRFVSMVRHSSEKPGDAYASR